jgi:hypothetical protein
MKPNQLSAVKNPLFEMRYLGFQRGCLGGGRPIEYRHRLSISGCVLASGLRLRIVADHLTCRLLRWITAQSRTATTRLMNTPSNNAVLAPIPPPISANIAAATSPSHALTSNTATITPAAIIITRLWAASLVSSAASCRLSCAMPDSSCHSNLAPSNNPAPAAALSVDGAPFAVVPIEAGKALAPGPLARADQTTKQESRGNRNP